MSVCSRICMVQTNPFALDGSLLSYLSALLSVRNVTNSGCLSYTKKSAKSTGIVQVYWSRYFLY